MAVSTLPVTENLIGGEWRQARSGRELESRDPATGELLARIGQADTEDVDAAVRGALAGLETSRWGELPALRARVLGRMAAALEGDLEELARLNTRENGKPLEESRGELRASVDTLRYAAGMARNVTGRSRVNDPGSLSLVLRGPVGVVAQIVPWNYPVILLFRELAPALAAGNAVVVKPASETTAITVEVVRRMVAVDELPRGIVSLVSGPGSEVGAALAAHPGVSMVALTGSVATGREVYRLAAGGLKRVHLELGGKSPQVLFADADLERALPTIFDSAFVNAGQYCMCGSRLLVEASVHDAVLRWLVSRAEARRVGNGLDETTEMGPIISEQQLAKVLGRCEAGRREAELVTGGTRLTGPQYDRGHFMAPTIFAAPPQQAALVQQEVFGPVLTVQSFRTEAEALALANGTPFGLVAGVWTRDLDRALRMGKGIRAGTVWVNTYNRLFAELEFGGSKESGLGRTRGLAGLEEFTELKHLNIELGGS